MDGEKDQRAFKRLAAIHLLLLGVSFQQVRAHSRVSERALRLWIKRFNERGIDGITYRPLVGRPRKMAAAEVKEKILPLLEDPKAAGYTHWTIVKLCGWLKEKKGLDLSYATLIRYLHQENYVRRFPRSHPQPPDKDLWLEKREHFAQELVSWLEDPDIDIFFGDESGFEGDPRPRQKWVKRGSSPAQGYYGGHVRQSVVGAINPASGQLVSLIVPHNDTQIFQAFLDTMAKEVPHTKKKVYLILDNASWHKSKSLNWHHIKAKYLPPYSPDFNPIERLWLYLKNHYLAGYITNDVAKLSEKLCSSIKNLLHHPKSLQSICNPIRS